MLVVVCRRPCLRPLLLLLPLSAVSTSAAHLPFSHHNLLPSMNRKHGKAMPFKAVEVPTGNTPEDAAARPDYCLAHQAPIAAFEFPSGGVLFRGVKGALMLSMLPLWLTIWQGGAGARVKCALTLGVCSPITSRHLVLVNLAAGSPTDILACSSPSPAVAHCPPSPHLFASCGASRLIPHP